MDSRAIEQYLSQLPEFQTPEQRTALCSSLPSATPWNTALLNARLNFWRAQVISMTKLGLLGPSRISLNKGWESVLHFVLCLDAVHASLQTGDLVAVDTSDTLSVAYRIFKTIFYPKQDQIYFKQLLEDHATTLEAHLTTASHKNTDLTLGVADIAKIRLILGLSETDTLDVVNYMCQVGRLHYSRISECYKPTTFNQAEPELIKLLRTEAKTRLIVTQKQAQREGITAQIHARDSSDRQARLGLLRQRKGVDAEIVRLEGVCLTLQTTRSGLEMALVNISTTEALKAAGGKLAIVNGLCSDAAAVADEAADQIAAVGEIWQDLNQVVSEEDDEEILAQLEEMVETEAVSRIKNVEQLPGVPQTMPVSQQDSIDVESKAGKKIEKMEVDNLLIAE